MFMWRSWAILLATLHQHACAEWRLTFSDEFDGSSLNSSTWTAADNYTHGSTELQLYVKSAVSVADGVLRLTTQYDPTKTSEYGRDGYLYTSGWVDSGIPGARAFDPTATDGVSNFAQAFGKWDIRARIPTSKAAQIWPALWFMPAPESTNPPYLCWPAGGEIDLMEMWGQGRASDSVAPSQSTYHYTTHGGTVPSECGSDYDQYDKMPNEFKYDTDEDWAAAFHVWTLVWNTTSINFLIDGELYGSISATDVTPIPQTPFYAIFNTAICGAEYCRVNEDPGALLPVVHEIDYIRVYEYVGDQQ